MIYPKMAWRAVVLSLMLLLSGSLASQGGFLKTDFGDCEGDTSLIANGLCDDSVNTADCGFDGGDCCECTCVSDDGSPCDRAGESFFACRDPDAPVDCDSAEGQSQVLTATSDYSQCAGRIPRIRDGRCDEANNNANCGFDGGDCCASTCARSLVYACGDFRGGGFDCRDPLVVTPHRGLNSASCDGNIDDIGNTICDRTLNNFECGYDGGDCCECTCELDLSAANDDQIYIADYCLDGDFDCIDPSADCESSGGTPAVNPTPSPVYTIPVPSPTSSPVPSSPVNPVAIPIERPAPTPAPSPAYRSSSECGYPEANLGDGYCDSYANTFECNWDEGDCCRCTCEDTLYYECSEYDFYCLDPFAPTDCESDSSGSWTYPVPSPIYELPDSSVTSPTSAVIPTPSPIYTSAEPMLTVRPVASTTYTSVESESDSPAPSDILLDDDSSTDGGDLEEEVADTGSATLTATRGTSVFNWQFVGVLSASVLGHCFIAG